MQKPQRIVATVLAGALALSLSVAAFAQQGGRRGGFNGVPQAFLTKLNLNADQQTKMKAAGDALKADMEKVNALTTPDEKKQARMKAIADYKATVDSTLTPDQQKQLQGMMEEAKEYQGLGGLGNQLVGLNLTAEQKTKVKEIAAKYQPEMQKLRDEQKAATDKTAGRQQMRELGMKIFEEVKAVLTPDQQKQFMPPGRRNQNPQ
jgi:Spy/CpxP family protein refolding chaperone